ncbi:hypothetical protein ABZ413_05415 [Nocardia rhamnosiphila]
MPEDAVVNTVAPVEQPRLVGRVREIQTKLHRWAGQDPDRRFCDLFNLVADPAFLAAAWIRVRGNRGAKTAGVDGRTVFYIEQTVGVPEFRSSWPGSAGICAPGCSRRFPCGRG